MSSENISVSNAQPSVTSRRASTPLPPKPPPPPPMKRHSVTDSSEISTNDATLPSIHETASNSSPPIGPQKKPPPAPKPSRLTRALSSGYMTLPSFWRNHKRSKSAKENEKIKELGKVNGKEQLRKEKNPEAPKVEDKMANESDGTSNTANGPELRDAPLWKLPGLEITQRRHSTSSLDKDGSPKPPSKSGTHEVPELPDTVQQLPEHLNQEDLPHKPITATTRKLPNVPSEIPEHQPSPRPTASAANTRELPELPDINTRELPELPNTPRQLPEHHPKPVVTSRELPELPSVLPQLPEQHSPGSAAVVTTRELPALPNQMPAESAPIPIPVAPLSESPPMHDSPQPPELPPRPEAPLISLGMAASQESVVTEQRELPALPTVPTAESGVGKSISLRDFVQKHSKSFPIRIRVLQGYCSEDSEFNISTDDMYNIHFIKHTKVVTIRDEDGVTYSLPLGSAMKFGFIYNPSSDLDKALTGYIFEKVSDITAMPTLPKIIRTTKSVQSSDDKWALEEGEMLVIRHIHKPVFKGRKGLKVFSLLTKSDKILPEDCAGHFSTKPSLVQLHLPEIIQHIPNPFPSLAVMYSTSGSTLQLHNPGTQSRVITMCESSCETSLVASPAVQEGQEGENHNQILFDIPLNDDISDMEVEVIQTQDEEDSEHLYDDTLNIFEKFDPTKLQPLKSMASSPPSKSQPLFLHSVRRGYEKVGVNIEPPYVNIQKARCVTAKEEAEKDADDQSNGYATVGFKLSSRWHSYDDEDNESAGYDHVGYDKPDQGDPKLTSWVQDLHTATQALEGRLSSLEGGQPSAEIGRFESIICLIRTY